MNGRSRRATMCVAMVLAACLAAPAWAAEYVVDQKNPAAGDDGPGTPDKPFKTVSKAVASVQSGDTVLVKAGVYRETVTVKTSGAADKPITLKGATGERVLISGAQKIEGWKKVTRDEARGNPNWEHLYVAELPEPPDGLFQKSRALLPSRWPAAGRLPAEGGGKDSVLDSRNLTQPTGHWEGGTLVVRVAKGGSYFREPIVKYDLEKHELRSAAGRRARSEAIVPADDTYWIEAAVAAIDEPGQFALDARSKPVKVYVWPMGDADPGAQPVETRVQGNPFLVGWGPGVAHVRFENLEAAYATGSGFGADAKTGKDAHDILIDHCLAHHNARAGCSLSGQRAVTVRRSLFCRNDYGILTSGITDTTFEEDYALSNNVDGIVISWKSDNVRVVRSATVDHWWESHPDTFQIYRDVTNLTVDSCLLLNGGQGMMMSEADGVRLVNNMIVGTHIKAVILAGVIKNYEMVHNTIAFPGLEPISSACTNLVLKDSVILPGSNELAAIRKTPATVDYNLYWRPEGVTETMPEGQNAHSIYAAPKFRCAPPELRSFIIQQWGAGRAITAQCTPGKFYLPDKPVSSHFQPGDWVEVNYDGLPRRVTEVTEDFVAFAPPLKELHPWWSDVIVNWKGREDFAWDLRLADGSPGKGAAEDGKDMGSSVDIQAYLKGDFDGDGRRDVPDLPENFDRRR